MLYKIFYGLMTLVYATVLTVVGLFTLYKLGVDVNPAYAIPFLIFWQFTKRRALGAIGIKYPVYKSDQVLREIAAAMKADDAAKAEGK